MFFCCVGTDQDGPAEEFSDWSDNDTDADLLNLPNGEKHSRTVSSIDLYDFMENSSVVQSC